MVFWDVAPTNADCDITGASMSKLAVGCPVPPVPIPIPVLFRPELLAPLVPGVESADAPPRVAAPNTPLVVVPRAPLFDEENCASTFGEPMSDAPAINARNKLKRMEGFFLETN